MKRIPCFVAHLLAASALAVAVVPSRAGGLRYVTSYDLGPNITPGGVTVSGGLVYFTDTTSDAVYRFDPKHFASSLTSFGGNGTSNNPFGLPVGVARRDHLRG